MTTDTGPTIDLTEARAALRAKLAKIKAEEKRLEAVQAGRDKARQVQREHRDRLDEIETTLRTARSQANLNLAYRYLNNEGDDSDPVVIAEAEAARVGAEIAKLEGIESALSEEINRVEDGLRTLHLRKWESMAALIAASPEYQLLCAEHVAAFKRLRSIKTTLRLIGNALNNALRQEFAANPERAEPMDERREYPIDHELVEAWQESLAQLQRNADADLPGMPGHPTPAPPAPNGRNGRNPSG